METIVELEDFSNEIKCILESERSTSNSPLDGLLYAFGDILEKTGQAGGTIIRSIGTAFKQSLEGVDKVDRGIINALGYTTWNVIQKSVETIHEVTTGVPEAVEHVEKGFFTSILNQMSLICVILVLLIVAFLVI